MYGTSILYGGWHCDDADYNNYHEITLTLRSVTDAKTTAYRLEVWLSSTYPANTAARTI